MIFGYTKVRPYLGYLYSIPASLSICNLVRVAVVIVHVNHFNKKFFKGCNREIKNVV